MLKLVTVVSTTLFISQQTSFQQTISIRSYKAIMFKHFGALLSLMAFITGNTLAIITSGLWYLNLEGNVTGAVVANIQPGWAVDFSNSSYDFYAATQLWDTAYYDSQMGSKLIHQEKTVLLEVRELQPTFSSFEPNSTSQTYTLKALTALQPFLECSAVPSSAFKYNIKATDEISIWTDFKYPAGCISMYNHDGSMRLETMFKAGPLINGGELNPRGMVYHIGVSSDGSTDSCPSVFVLFGLLGVFLDSKDQPYLKHNFTALGCTQHVRTVNGDVLYASNSQLSRLSGGIGAGTGTNTTSQQTADDIVEVHLDASTARALRNEATGMNSLSYYISGALNQLEPPPSDPAGNAFISSVVESHEKHGGESLDLIDPHILVPAANRVYQKLMTGKRMPLRVDMEEVGMTPYLQTLILGLGYSGTAYCTGWGVGGARATR